MKIMFLAAGAGSRFAQEGYGNCKPLIDVLGKPMIQRVVENINLPGEKIFLVLKEHYEKYHLKYLLPLICKNDKCQIVVVDKITSGAACTALLAKEFIQNDDSLMIVNSDQLVNWSPNHFISYLEEKKADGGIVTFHMPLEDAKWSFVKTETNSNLVTELAEKVQISNIATAGLYWFKSGRLFVEAAEEMINKNIRVNNEFYLAPSYNQLIEKNCKVYSYMVPEFDGLGTPNDLRKYLSKYEANQSPR